MGSSLWCTIPILGNFIRVGNHHRVHHVSTEKGKDIFILVEKDYPLTKRLATLMLSNKLRVDQQSEMADELLIKIYNIGNKPRNQGQLVGICIVLYYIYTIKRTTSLKRRVKKLEKKHRSRTHRLKRLYKVGLTARVESSDDEDSLGKDASKQGRIDDIDADEEITLVSVHDMNVYAGEEVVEEVVEVINTAKLIIDASQVSAAGDKVSTSSVATTVSASTTTTATITTVDDITLAQALEEMKSTQLSSQQSQDKGKGILIEPVKKKDQILLDEETALNLQAEFDEKERLTREKAEKEQAANIALIET
ncbi:hypothetical protein Tco_0256502 [Tanacetum coccineum]